MSTKSAKSTDTTEEVTPSSSTLIVLVGQNGTLERYLQRFGDVLVVESDEDIPSDDFLRQCKGVVFGGGDDVPHGLYDEEEGEHRKTSSYGTERTLLEVDIFDACQRVQVPTVGICRGAQFLCAMSGGKVVQHVTGHLGSHNVSVRDPETGFYKKDPVRTRSTHHQMMMPFVIPEKEYFIVAKSSTRMSEMYERGPNAEDYTDEDMLCEPEIVLFKSTNALAIQGHPEYTYQNSAEFIEYCDYIINLHLQIH